jgi:hypothetical protein
MNVESMIRTQPKTQTGALGDALKAKLLREQREAFPGVASLKAEKREGSHTIRIDRSKLAFELIAPQGYPMATGTFPSIEDLSGNVANFLAKHPKTNVTYTD